MHLTRLATALILALLVPGVLLSQQGPSDSILSTGRHPWAQWPNFSRHVDDVKSLHADSSGLLWLRGGALNGAGRQALALIHDARLHGLDPADYDAGRLDSLFQVAVSDPADQVRADLLLTIDLVRYLDDLRTGRLHPRRIAPAGFDLEPWSLPQVIREAIAGDSVGRLGRAAAPAFAQYRLLQAALARYRHLARDSAVPALPLTPVLRPGDPYANDAVLRHVLLLLGDLPPWARSPTGSYDHDLAEAVTQFQRRHGLEPDGILGPVTLRELRVPMAYRVRQIEYSLERLRWLPAFDSQRLLVVNIPAFQLFAFDSIGGSGRPSLEMRAIVGRALETRTPMLFEYLRYVEFRPYWNVPRSILMKEVLPTLRRRPGYLQANSMEIVGAGDSVLGDQPTAELLEGLASGAYRVRQRPGPDNALGLVKFVFPNAANVYLHGTPFNQLFGQARRDLSHGCIRLENPAVLAGWVLRDTQVWSRERIMEAMADSVSSRAMLQRPMPVIIFYTTVVAHPDGPVFFYPDIYQHDETMAEAMRAGPTVP